MAVVKWTVQWRLEHSRRCATITSTWYLNTSITAEQNFLLIKQVLLHRPLLQVFILRSLLPLEFILLCGVSGVQLHSSARAHQLSQHHLLKMIFFATDGPWYPCRKPAGHRTGGQSEDRLAIPLPCPSAVHSVSWCLAEDTVFSRTLYINTPQEFFKPPSHSPHPPRVTSPTPTLSITLYIHSTPIFISPAQRAFWSCNATWPDACWSSFPDLTNLTHINLNSGNPLQHSCLENPMDGGA